ncbi:MAG: glycosyltransferase [Solirubrobacteraceae bacterium]
MAAVIPGRVRATLTVCTIARNEERRLQAALGSARAIADEIVVVDSGSTDRTVEIALAAGARVIEHPWSGFARQRNMALDAATGDWVLELDADERVTPELAREIQAFLALPPPPEIRICSLPMRHRFLGRVLGPAGRYPFYRSRLIRRGAYRHDETRSVHEGLWAGEPPWVFTGDLEHELAGSLREALRDTWAYARLSATGIDRVSDRDLIIGVLVRPAAKFLFGAFVLGGVRDGPAGLTRIVLECCGDATTWILARRRGGRDGGGRSGPAGHFGRPGEPQGPGHLLAVGDPRNHWQWLEAVARAGAFVSVVCAADQAVERRRGGERLRVRTATGRGPVTLLRAAAGEAQISPISASVALDRRGAVALRLAPGGRGEVLDPASVGAVEAARLVTTVRQSATRSRSIVCVGFNDWDAEAWSNQQHLMSRLAASGTQVLFVESLGLRRPRFGSGRDLRRIARRLGTGLRGPRRRGNVTVLSPLVLPVHDRAAVRALNAALLRWQVAVAARRLGMRQPILWAYVPQAEALLETVDPAYVVYHCVDDIAAQEGIDEASFNAAEARFVARADLVLASAPPLAQRMRTLSDHVLLAPNVADTSLFATALDDGPLDPGVAPLPAPRIVFVGAVAARKVDLELVAAIASARPGWSVILVGPVGLGDPSTDVSALREAPNVHLLGVRRQDELPAVLRGADAGLIPYRSTRLTASIFPMKLYEFLSAGVPLVATGLPSVSGVDGVELVDGVAAVVAALERALSTSPERRRGLSAAAAAHSWSARLAEIDAALP